MNYSLVTRVMLAAILCNTASSLADITLMKKHCAECHTGPKPKGDFSLHDLRNAPDARNAEYWIGSLERVRAREMPPAKRNKMTERETLLLEESLERQIAIYEERLQRPLHTSPRRLNNRELENSLREVLLVEDTGTHDPLAMLLGDTLHHGFDTHGETLGMSEYHLDQYVAAIRKVLDNVILSGEQPKPKRYSANARQLVAVDTGNRKRRDRTSRTSAGVDIRGTQQAVFMSNLPSVPHTGYYKISVRAKAIDRHVYSQTETGIYDDDPITLRMHIGGRLVDFQLGENEQAYQTRHWLHADSRIEFMHHTDGLRLRGNGNFKFQNRIAHDYIKANKPDLYKYVVSEVAPKAKFRSSQPSHWVHWVPYWQGPRPLIASITVEGPLFESWPPQRQVALLGRNPKAENALDLLKPIAERAWRREVPDAELKPIVALVESQKSLGDVSALKEGIVAILVSPSFLMINPEETPPHNLFATKLSYLLGSAPPKPELLAKARRGELASFDQVRDELQGRLSRGQAQEFLKEFPHAWLQLDRINFMAPDVDRFPLYEKKAISEDMVNEVLAFFRHNVEMNRPVPELLTADYSFVNADLAGVYGLQDVPNDSVLRKHVFTDGRRGGFLGMGAFLTLTADTLSTSPIHRAVYVMENFMGIHPAPPPADVEISEPDIRSAKTIREVLQAHRSQASCAACHQNIDPFGYAFENFDPIGAWRDNYAADSESKSGRTRAAAHAVPIDASATFLSGASYKDIRDFRKLMKQDASRDRFVRCFVTKLLTYANGSEPTNFTEIEAIVRRSASHDYKIVETMAATMDSPLFRETRPQK